MNIIGSNTIVLSEVESTNKYASMLLSQSKHLDGTIVLTDFQNKGKGQGENIWISEINKNLLFSVILKPGFLKVDRQFYLSIAISLGIFNTLKYFSKGDIKIKWPNDIFIDNKKICGLLIQNVLSGNRIKSSVVGIGLNINQTDFGNVLPNATSLSIVEEKIFDRELVFKNLVKEMNLLYERLSKGEFQNLKMEYDSKLYKLNEVATYRLSNGNYFEGEIIGVDDIGMLKILINSEIKKFMHKEIIFL